MYIANNSRTQNPSVPRFGMKVPHLRCDLHTSFKVKRSKVKVTDGWGHTVSAEPAATLLVNYCRPPETSLWSNFRTIQYSILDKTTALNNKYAISTYDSTSVHNSSKCSEIDAMDYETRTRSSQMEYKPYVLQCRHRWMHTKIWHSMLKRPSVLGTGRVCWSHLTVTPVNTPKLQ